MINLVLSSFLIVSTPMLPAEIEPHMIKASECIAMPVNSKSYKDKTKITLVVKCDRAYRVMLLDQMSGVVKQEVEVSDTGFGPHLTPVLIDKWDEGRLVLSISKE